MGCGPGRWPTHRRRRSERSNKTRVRFGRYPVRIQIIPGYLSTPTVRPPRRNAPAGNTARGASKRNPAAEAAIVPPLLFYILFPSGTSPAPCRSALVVEANSPGDLLCPPCQLLTLRPFAPIVRCCCLFDWFDNFRRKTPKKREKLFDRFEFTTVGRSCIDE